MNCRWSACLWSAHSRSRFGFRGSCVYPNRHEPPVVGLPMVRSLTFAVRFSRFMRVSEPPGTAGGRLAYGPLTDVRGSVFAVHACIRTASVSERA
jgi:hypothetical protein